jgi:tetratricopeptide (TPR) repeat protein
MQKKSNSRRKLTRRQLRDLDVEIDFMEGLIRRDPQYIEALQVLGDDYTCRGRFDESLQVDERLVDLRPSDPMAFYNLACSYALTEQIEYAAKALSKAIDRGYRDFRYLSKDPHLENLRRHPLFKKTQAKIRSLKVKEIRVK